MQQLQKYRIKVVEASAPEDREIFRPTDSSEVTSRLPHLGRGGWGRTRGKDSHASMLSSFLPAECHTVKVTSPILSGYHF